MRAHARNTDIRTSHDAADSVEDLTALQNRIMSLFGGIGNGLTDEELIRAYARAYGSFYPSSDSSIRSRRSELVHTQFLRDSGDKRLTKAGRATTVWRLWSVLL